MHPKFIADIWKKTLDKKLAISSFFATCRSSSISRMFLRDIETWTRIGPPKIPCQSTSCIIHFAKWKKNYLQNPVVGEHCRWNLWDPGCWDPFELCPPRGDWKIQYIHDQNLWYVPPSFMIKIFNVPPFFQDQNIQYIHPPCFHVKNIQYIALRELHSYTLYGAE